MSRYRIAELARTDLEGIWDYIGIEKDNPEAAQRQIDELFEKFTVLANNPRIGQLREDLRPDLRVFPAGQYVILSYSYSRDDGIDVVGVVHGARDLRGLIQRGER